MRDKADRHQRQPEPDHNGQYSVADREPSERLKLTGCFGTRSCPLAYTALQGAPTAITVDFRNQPGGDRLNLIGTVALLGEVGELLAQITMPLQHGQIQLNLDGLKMRPGIIYRWSAMFTGPDPIPEGHELNADFGGVFWLLEAEELEKVSNSVQMLMNRADTGFLTAAKALLMANHTLYQRALNLVPCPPSDQHHKEAVFTHTVRSVIFRQMLDHAKGQFPEEKQIIAWIARNEEWHRQLAQEGVRNAR